MPRTDSNSKLEAAKPVEPVKPEPARTASPFDMPEPVTFPPTGVTQSSSEAEILAEVNEQSAEEEDSGEAA